MFKGVSILTLVMKYLNKQDYEAVFKLLQIIPKHLKTNFLQKTIKKGTKKEGGTILKRGEATK